jgi:hypothetical protein
MVATIYGKGGNELGKILISYDMLVMFSARDLYLMYNSGISFNEIVAKVVVHKAKSKFGDFDSYTLSIE